MAYLDQILPVSSTVEAVEVTRSANVCGPGLPKTLPTDLATLRVLAICTACVFLMYAHVRVFCVRVFAIMHTHELTHA